MKAVTLSGDRAIAEDLLTFLVAEAKDQAAFAAALYTCYDVHNASPST